MELDYYTERDLKEAMEQEEGWISGSLRDSDIGQRAQALSAQLTPEQRVEVLKYWRPEISCGSFGDPDPLREHALGLVFYCWAIVEAVRSRQAAAAGHEGRLRQECEAVVREVIRLTAADHSCREQMRARLLQSLEAPD